MTEVLLHTLVTTLDFLALINPVSKVSVLAVLCWVGFNALQMALDGISAWQAQPLP